MERLSNCDLSLLDFWSQELASRIEHELHLFEEQLESLKRQVFVFELQELHLLSATHLLEEAAFKLSDSVFVVFVEIELDSDRFSQQLQRFEFEGDFELEETAKLLLALLFDFFDSATRSTKNLGG